MVEIPNPFEKAPADPKKKGGGLFGQHKEEKKTENPISEELEGTISRLRMLEERYSNVQAELRVTEENMIHRNRKVKEEVKTFTSEINELKKEIGEIKEKVLEILHEIEKAAKKADFEVLRKYVEMWEPMNFVTHNEVQEIIDEKLRKRSVVRATK